MKYFKWEHGRQNKNYKKLLLISGKNFDCYLIKYYPKCYINSHTDKIYGYKHYRINILLKGQDCYNGKTLFKWWRIIFFRPDLFEHRVGPITKKRYILSIGLKIKHA